MYCSKSNKEALEYHVKSLRTQFINVFMVVMSENHANSKFPSKAGDYNCWIHDANISSEAVIFTVFKGPALFSPVALLNLQKGASSESPIDFVLLHWCCTRCFLLKMNSRLCFCFCRRKEYSFFFLGLLSLTQNEML